MKYLYRIVDRHANDAQYYDNGEPRIYRSMMRALNECDYLSEFQSDLAPYTVIRVADPDWKKV